MLNATYYRVCLLHEATNTGQMVKATLQSGNGDFQCLPNKQVIQLEILDLVCAMRGFELFIKRMLKHVCKVMRMNQACGTLSVLL